MQNILDVCPFSLAVPCCYPPLVNYYIVINISSARSIFSVGLTLRSNCPPWVRYIANVRHSDKIPPQIPNFAVTQRIWFIRFTWLLSVTRLLNDYTTCLSSIHQIIGLIRLGRLTRLTPAHLHRPMEQPYPTGPTNPDLRGRPGSSNSRDWYPTCLSPKVSELFDSNDFFELTNFCAICPYPTSTYWDFKLVRLPDLPNELQLWNWLDCIDSPLARLMKQTRLTWLPSLSNTFW